MSALRETGLRPERVVTPRRPRKPPPRRTWLAAAPLGPAVAYLLLLLAAPLVVFFLYSFWATRNYDVVAQWNIDSYRLVVTDPIYRNLLWNTIKIALASSVASVIIAYRFAHILRFRLQRWQEPLLFLVLIALFSGYLVRIYAWRTLLGNRGIVNDSLVRSGVIDHPLSFLFYNRFAAIIVLTNFLLPIALLPVYAALQNVTDDEVAAARDLGAGPVQTFWKVTLPRTRDGVFFAFALTFIIASGDYVTPQLVGGSSGVMIGKSISDTFLVSFNWPRGAALSFMTLATFGTIIAVVRVGIRRLIR